MRTRAGSSTRASSSPPDSGYRLRRAVDAVCRLAGLRPNIRLQSRSPHTLLVLAEAQHGVAIIASTFSASLPTSKGPPSSLVQVGHRRYSGDAFVTHDPSRTWREDHHCSATIARTLRASSSDIVVSCFGQSLTETWENTCSTTVLPTRGLILLTRQPSTQSPGRKCHHRVVANDDHLSGQSRTGKAKCRCLMSRAMPVRFAQRDGSYPAPLPSGLAR